MKGKIEKFTDFYYISKNRVCSDEDYMVIEEEDMDEFMDDISSQYLKEKMKPLKAELKQAIEGELNKGMYRGKKS